MDDLVKLTASAVSRTGVICTENTDSFYMDGRFLHDQMTENIQVSIENSAGQFLFSVSEGMDNKVPDKKSAISFKSELKKIHEKITSGQKDVAGKFQELYDSVVETDNLIYSVLPGNEEEQTRKTGFAGLLISDGKAAIFNAGGTRVYLARGSETKQLTADYKRAERLLKMGIITDEQAEVLTSRYGISTTEGRPEIRKSEIFNIKKGDIFLLCSKGLIDNVEDEKINELLILGQGTDEIADSLVKEAVKNGAKENVTALVAKIEKAAKKYGAEDEDEDVIIKGRRTNRFVPRYTETSSDEEGYGSSGWNVKKLAITVFVCIGIGIMIFAAYKLWDNSNKSAQTGDMGSNTSYVPTVSGETNPDGQSGTSTSGEVSTDTSGQTTAENTTIENTGTGNGAAGGSTTQNTTTKEPVKYKVLKGDSLISISRKFYNDPDQYKLIMEANNIKDPDMIKIGQVLVIPELKS